jgi:hypothetical protein
MDLVEELDEPVGVRPSPRTVDAIVMASAASPGDVVLTSDPTIIDRLPAHLPVVRLVTAGYGPQQVRRIDQTLDRPPP